MRRYSAQRMQPLPVRSGPSISSPMHRRVTPALRLMVSISGGWRYSGLTKPSRKAVAAPRC
eukprot:5798270-Alexandrium_andersonii.AAC.1